MEQLLDAHLKLVCALSITSLQFGDLFGTVRPRDGPQRAPNPEGGYHRDNNLQTDGLDDDIIGHTRSPQLVQGGRMRLEAHVTENEEEIPHPDVKDAYRSQQA